MSNRFKFKCFNKLQNKMYEVRSISYYQGDVKRIGVDDNGKILIFDEYENNIDNTILMQCTDLRDKHNKLIYEGDIVRFKDCNDILVINYQKEMACFAPQFYCNGKYGGRLWFDDYDSFECQFYKSNNFEIIGNIYENKELLNE